MWQRIRPTALDAGLTVGLGSLFLVSTLASSDEGRSLDGFGWLLLGANTLPLLGLRHNPLAVALALCAAYPAWAAFEYPTHIIQSLPTLAALGTTGAATKPLWWRAIALLTPIEMLAVVLLGIWHVDLLEIGYIAIVFAVVWALGVALGSRRDHARALTEKTVALQEAREELARRAVSEERTRIARDLHDIVAHAMSVITVQAGVGAHLIKRSPEKAEAALRAIEETGRGALDDMRRMLGALRSDELSTQPQPTLNSLDLLVANVESAGTPVQVRIEGAARPLPAGLELTAYRIAQEALTNSVKHAPGARASLTLRYGPDDIAIEIVDSGGSPDPAPNDGGQGLKGMRERVELYGGSVEAGPHNDGFRVVATFPVDAP
ncbi:MAG TPA: sensor histidine kinase [Actinomycetota bacterium]|nr:sensor histidine kinase [Actinomycetota bacterium]